MEINSQDRITVFVKEDPYAIGEINVDLDDCFSQGEPTKFISEIIYFNKMLDMFAALCQSRNYICKETISQGFPLQILNQNLWNDGLSKEIKAAFARLLTNIYNIK